MTMKGTSLGEVVVLHGSSLGWRGEKASKGRDKKVTGLSILSDAA